MKYWRMRQLGFIAAAALVLSACNDAPTNSPPNASAPSQCTGPNSATVSSATTSNATAAQVLDAVKAAECLVTVPDSVASTLTKTVKAVPTNGFECNDVDGPGDAIFGQCGYGHQNGKKLMVIYGDSRAEMWAATLEGVASKYGWKLRVFALGDCPVPDLQFTKKSQDMTSDCNDFHASAPPAINALHPDLVITTSLAYLGVVLSDGSHPTPDQWQKGWESTFAKLTQPGTRLAMIGTIPDWGSKMDPQCLAAHLKDVQKCAVPVRDGTADGATAEIAAAKSTGAQYVSSMQWVCADLCEPIIANTRVYNAGKHFSMDYALYLTAALGESLQPSLS